MPPRILGQAALFLMLHEQDAVTGGGPWSALAHRRFGDVAQRTYKFDDREVTVRILPSGYEVEVDGSGTVDRASASLQDRTELVTQWSDTRLASTIIPSGGHKLHIFDSGRQYVLHHTPSEVEADSAATTQTANAMTSPMPATVIEVRVKPGDKVEANQVVCVLESMKMEINIRAGRDGVVGAVNVEKGQVVEEGAVLVALESDESA
jgi:3-methylcrotonyl-CoA carboxylase alpha subunit